MEYCKGKEYLSTVTLALVVVITLRDRDMVVVAQAQSGAPTPAPTEPNSKSGGINKFCMTAIDMQLCTRMVNGPTNWNEAVTNGINSTIDHVKMMQVKTIPEVKAAFANKHENSINSAISSCDEDFERIIEGLNAVILSMAREDTRVMKYNLASALRLLDCLQNFSDFDVTVPPLLKSTSNELDLRISNLQEIVKLQFA